MKTSSTFRIIFRIVLTTITAATLLVGCAGGLNLPSNSSSLNERSNTNLSLAVSSNTVTADTSILLQVSGGVQPYAFNVISGGGTITTWPPIYKAPVIPASVIINVTDANGSVSTVNLNVVPGTAISLSATATSLQPGQMALLEAAGGTPPYAFSIGSGSGKIDASGLFVAGSTAGTTTINVTDTSGNLATLNMTISPSSGTTSGIVMPMAVAGANEWFDQSNPKDLTWVANNVVDNNLTTVFSSPLVAAPGDLTGAFIAAWPGSVNAVSLSYVVLTAFFDYNSAIPLGFPTSYTISVTKEDNSGWIQLPGTFTTQPNSSGVAVVNLGGTFQTHGVLITPILAGPTVYGQFAMQFAEIHWM